MGRERRREADTFFRICPRRYGGDANRPGNLRRISNVGWPGFTVEVEPTHESGNQLTAETLLASDRPRWQLAESEAKIRRWVAVSGEWWSVETAPPVRWRTVGGSGGSALPTAGDQPLLVGHM